MAKLQTPRKRRMCSQCGRRADGIHCQPDRRYKVGPLSRAATPKEIATYKRAWYQQPIIKARHKKYYDDGRELILTKYKVRYAETRRLVLDAYGAVCACCGEKNEVFLTLDHINNDGAAHRKQTTTDMWNWARRNDFPPILQLLCYNCNMAKQHAGVCHVA